MLEVLYFHPVAQQSLSVSVFFSIFLITEAISRGLIPSFLKTKCSIQSRKISLHFFGGKEQNLDGRVGGRDLGLGQELSTHPGSE